MQRDHIDRRLAECVRDLDLDLDVEAIVQRIQGIEKRLRWAMEDTLAEHGLTLGEWQVLGSLRRTESFASTPGGLAAGLDLSSGAMTNRLDRLERAGLVRRLRDPDDRRGVIVELTDEGSKAWVESTSTQARKEALVAGALSKEEQALLNALLRKLMLEFERSESPELERPELQLAGERPAAD
jgi:DNA-binding MarR family transcriptional regulator